MPPFESALRVSLKRERNTAANHAEVIPRTIHDVPAEVVHPADCRGEANFDAAAELANRLRFAVVTTHADDTALRIEQQHVTAPATEDRTAASKNVRCEPRAWN